MKCGFCERIKKLKGMQIAMIGVVCLGVYLANYSTLKEHKERQAAIKASEQKATQQKALQNKDLLDKAQKPNAINPTIEPANPAANPTSEASPKPQISLEAYEALQKQCYFGKDKSACEELKRY